MPRHRLRNCFQAHPLKFRVTFNNSDYWCKQAITPGMRVVGVMAMFQRQLLMMKPRPYLVTEVLGGWLFAPEFSSFSNNEGNRCG